MAMNSSSKYDKITCKVLIQSGSPTVYQLKPKKEKIGTLTRMNLGERNLNKTNRTILLVGESGAGKSTLINALVNYTMGVKWEENVWFQIVEDEKRSQSESQTSDVIVYQIFGFEGKTLPYSLTIIDTPGYGDTRGIEDDFISQRLLDLFCSVDGVHEINAVGLVLRVTDNRLCDRLSYVFDSVMSLFGKDMEMNIVALITHSDGRTPKNVLKTLEDANIKCAKDEKNQPVYFLFDNCQDEDRNEDPEDLQNADTISTKGLRQFTDFLEITEPQKLKTTADVLNERIRLTASIHSLKERVEFIELKQKEIQQTEEGLKKYEQEMKNNEKFTVEVDEVYKGEQSIDGGMWGLMFYQGAVCCTVCKENCHYPGCTVAWYPRDCEVMKDGNCTVCTGKCPVSAHVKDKWIYVNKTRKVQKTFEDKKEKYEKNKTESESRLSILENLNKETEELQKDKDQWLEESFQHVVTLVQIALNAYSVSTLVHLDFLIEKMKEKGDTEKVQKLEEIKRRVNEGTRAALWYKFGKLTAAGKEAKK
ncbi:septin-2-like [Dicentrarchus labrax]|uniref:septin-2-like n=1 Tax=Dicentrarchus labrax TaxID=13489 RepID=UPI0021F5D889|nr:septin-2-like [Dicentrarchus labrax]